MPQLSAYAASGVVGEDLEDHDGDLDVFDVFDDFDGLGESPEVHVGLDWTADEAPDDNHGAMGAQVGAGGTEMRRPLRLSARNRR